MFQNYEAETRTNRPTPRICALRSWPRPHHRLCLKTKTGVSIAPKHSRYFPRQLRTRNFTCDWNSPGGVVVSRWYSSCREISRLTDSTPSARSDVRASSGNSSRSASARTTTDSPPDVGTSALPAAGLPVGPATTTGCDGVELQHTCTHHIIIIWLVCYYHHSSLLHVHLWPCNNLHYLGQVKMFVMMIMMMMISYHIIKSRLWRRECAKHNKGAGQYAQTKTRKNQKAWANRNVFSWRLKSVKFS